MFDNLPSLLQDTIQHKVETLEQLAAAQKELGKPFDEEDKLQQFVVRQSEINSALEFKELQGDPLLQKTDEKTHLEKGEYNQWQVLEQEA